MLEPSKQIETDQAERHQIYRPYIKNQVQSCHLYYHHHHRHQTVIASAKNWSAANTWRNRPAIYEIHNILHFMSIIHLSRVYYQPNDQLLVGSLIQFVRVLHCYHRGH